MLFNPHALRTLAALAVSSHTHTFVASYDPIVISQFSTFRSLRSGSEQASMASAQPQEGKTMSGRFMVKSSDLASVISPDATDVYPAVFATSRLVAFMEIVCARMLVPHLAPGQLSVGVRVDVTHAAATPVDEEVTVEATFRGKEAKLFAFDVVARDAGGEVGKAVHTRAVIDERRLLSGIEKRIGGGSKI